MYCTVGWADSLMHIQNVPGTKRTKGQNVPGAKRPKGQNVPGAKRPK